jgi:hypothetical protein
MDWTWLWQNLISNALWAILLLGGGIAVGILRAKKAAWASPIIYGIATIACLAIIIFTFTGHAVFSKPETDTSNIEDRVKEWITTLGLGSQPITGVPDTFFAYKIFLVNGNSVIVSRNSKSKSGYLQFQSVIVIAPEHRAMLAKLTKDQATAVEEELVQHLADSKMGYSISGSDPGHMESIALIHGVPIVGLTEAAFVDQIDLADSDTALVTTSLLLALQRNSPQAPLRSAHK